MSLFKQNIPAPAGGVSQLPPEIRGPGYADDLVNTFPSSPKGFGVRQGTTPLIGNLQALDSASVHTVELQPSDDERYLAVFDKNGVRVINLISGALAPLTVAGSASTFLSAGSFTSAGVDDTLYVAARGYSKAELSGDPVAPQQNGALITVVSGRPSAIYKITLDGISVFVRTPDDPPPQVKRPAIGLAIDSGGPPGTAMDVSWGVPSVSLLPGEETSVDVNISRTGYSGAVGLVMSSVPGGISASLASASVTGIGTTCGIAISSSATPGTYNVTINASGTAVSTRSASLTVIVRDPNSGDPGGHPTTAKYSITEANQSFNIVAGGDVSFTWDFVRTAGFTADISAGSVIPPTHFSMTAVMSDPAPNSQLVTHFFTDSGIAPGSHTFTLKFVAAGSADLFRTVTLNVASAAGSMQWSDTNSTEYTTTSPIDSIGLFMSYVDGFSSSVEVSVVSWDGPETLTLTPSTLSAPTDNHTTVAWDLTGQAFKDYHLYLKAVSLDAPTVYCMLTITYAESA